MVTRRKRYAYAPPGERRAVLYARYSSERQSDSWSLDAQFHDLRAYCERMGWAVVTECRDEAITGNTDERPGLKHALDTIRVGKANVLVVHKLDRFFRNMAKTFEYVAELEEYGAGLVCTQQPIDTTNPVSGKIVLAVMAALAEIYLDNLSEETAKGKRARAAAGLPNGDLPYGYAMPPPDSDTPQVKRIPQVVPAEAAVIRQAFAWYSAGQIGEAVLARRLNDHGYRMRSKQDRCGGLFTRDTVRSMLRNPFYAGWVVQPTTEIRSWSDRARDAVKVRGLHEAIISQEAYDAVQRTRADRWGHAPDGTGHRAAAPKRYHAPYLAAGLIRCTCCGQRLHGQRTGKNPTARYFCTWHYRGGLCESKRKSAPAEWVDNGIGGAVADMVLPESWRDYAATALAADSGTNTYEVQRGTLDRKLARLKSLLIDGDLSQQEYRTERSRIESEIARLSPPPEVVDRDHAAALLQDLSRLWEGAEVEERRELATQVFEAVYVNLDNPDAGLHCVLKESFRPLAGALEGGCRRVTDGHRRRLWYIDSLVEIDDCAA